MQHDHIRLLSNSASRSLLCLRCTLAKPCTHIHCLSLLHFVVLPKCTAQAALDCCLTGNNGCLCIQTSPSCLLLLKHLTSGLCNVVLSGTVLHHANMLPLANNATSAAAQANLPDSSCHVSKNYPTADWTPCLSQHACLFQHCTSMALHAFPDTLCSMINLSITLYMLVVFSSI